MGSSPNGAADHRGVDGIRMHHPTDRRSAATLADVAARVGVSARTVSRVVNGQGGCSAETRRRIEDAIAELGYRPNMMARGLLTNRTDTIGLVGIEMSDPFFTELADGVQRAARAAGKTMFFASTDDDATVQQQVLRSFEGRGVDGLIVFPVADTLDTLPPIAATGLPVVVINHTLTGPGVGMVQSDLYDGAVQAVRHLVAHGRRRIAMATDANTRIHQQSPRRQRGWADALREAGLPHDDSLVVYVENDIAGGVSAAHTIAAMNDRPDAVFAYNDLMAIGLLKGFNDLGVRVPDEIAVVGFDDVRMCEATSPRLTSVTMDPDKMGEAAVDLLIRLAADPAATLPPVQLPVRLVPRESS